MECQCGCGSEFVPGRPWAKYFPGHKVRAYRRRNGIRLVQVRQGKTADHSRRKEVVVQPGREGLKAALALLGLARLRRIIDHPQISQIPQKESEVTSNGI